MLEYAAIWVSLSRNFPTTLCRPFRRSPGRRRRTEVTEAELTAQEWFERSCAHLRSERRYALLERDFPPRPRAWTGVPQPRRHSPASWRSHKQNAPQRGNLVETAEMYLDSFSGRKPQFVRPFWGEYLPGSLYLDSLPDYIARDFRYEVPV